MNSSGASGARLEATLGERLFHRCERVLAEFEDLRADAAGTRAAPSGTLFVDLPSYHGRRYVMPLLARLQRAHPALTLEMRLQDGYGYPVRDGIDLAVRMGELRDSSLAARRIDWQHIVMVASPAYLKAHGTPRKFEDLAGHRAVAFRIPSTGRSRPRQLRQARRTVEMHPTHGVQLSDTETLGNTVLLGMGIAQLPDYTMQDDVARDGPAFGLRLVGRDWLAYGLAARGSMGVRAGTRPSTG